MTIASELTALQTNLENAYDAVEAKGGTLPAAQNFDNLDTAIGSIPSGGGMDTVEATNYTESAISTGDKVWINQEGTDYKLVDFYAKIYNNFTKIGSPTINENTGLASGFSGSNYCKLPQAFNPGSSAWEAVVCLSATSISTSVETHFFGCYTDQNSFVMTLKYKNGLYYATCYLSSNGSSFDIALSTPDIPFSLNTKTWIKLQFTGTQYILSTSTNKIDWTSQTISSSLSIYPNRDVYFGACWIPNDSYLQGTIYLDETYIKINGEDWWTPTEDIISGNITEDTLTGTAAENIAIGGTGDVEIGEIIEPLLGTKTITVNGTYNASSDNLDGYSSVTVDVPSGDTITAANNTGSAITSGNKVWVETESKNFTIVGSPTIVNKVVSNFSTSNYLQVSPLANTTSGTWTFDVEFTYVTNPYPPEASDPQSIVYFTDSGGDDRGVAIIEGILGGTIPSTNSDGYEYLESSTALTSGETYQLQIELTANSGKFYIKHNGSIIETLSGQNGTYMPASITGFNLGGTGNYDRFVGSINLNNTNIKINNSTAWSPYSPANPYYLINFTDISSSTITGIAKENIAVSGTGDVDIGTIIAPTKKYNLLDRVKDDSNNEIGTVSGFFTDANNVEYAVVCLDAQYRLAGGQWCSNNQTTVTDLPTYSTAQWGPWEAKETATYNTQKILDFCTANGYTSTACSHCRTLSFAIDGTTYYGQLPNMIELSDIVRNHTEINTSDPTAGSYSSVDFSTTRYIWSSSQQSSSSVWSTGGIGYMSSNNKPDYYTIVPVLEIPNT